MEPKYITPTWARVLVVPWVLGFFLLGGVLIWFGYRVATKEPFWVASSIVLLAAFMLFVAWCGLDLLRSRNVSAAILGDRLIVRNGRKKADAEYRMEDVHVVDRPTMRLVHVVASSSGEKIFTVDYFYPFGMSVSREIAKRKADEPGARSTRLNATQDSGDQPQA